MTSLDDIINYDLVLFFMKQMGDKSLVDTWSACAMQWFVLNLDGVLVFLM